MSDPLLPLLREKRSRGWPKHEIGARVRYAPLSELLSRAYSTDAHFAAYSVPSIERRLLNAPPAWEHIDGGVPMLALILDVDCAASHRASGGSGAVSADDAWWDSTLQTIESIARVHERPFAFRTRGGARVVYRCAPFAIVDAVTAHRWKQFYLGACAYLARAFGLVCDASISDWPRLHRLPFVTRDGVAQRLDTFGDARSVGVFAFDPSAADLEHARALAATSKPWGAAVRLLEFNPETTATRARERTVRAPRPVESTLDSEALSVLARDLAAVVAQHSQRHQLHLALAGACYSRGVPLDQGAAFAARLCALSGETDDRPQVWTTTAERLRAGLIVQGYGALRAQWPDVADVLDTATQASAARKLAAELSARGTPPAVPASEAAAVLARVFEQPPLGLSLLRATEGAGKTRTFAQVAIRKALAAQAESATVHARDRILFVASSHAVARSVFDEIAAAGVPAEYWQSVLAVRSRDGTPECAYHVPLSALARGGHSPGATFCDGTKNGAARQVPCPKKAGCLAYKQATVKANAVLGHGPRVVVTVHALLSAGLDWLGPEGLAVIDEDPAAVVTHTITRESLEQALGAMESFQRSEQWRAVVLRILAAGLDRAEPLNELSVVLETGRQALSEEKLHNFQEVREFGVCDTEQLLRQAAERAAYRREEFDDGSFRWVRRSTWAPRLTSRVRNAVFFQGRVQESLVQASLVHGVVARALAGVARAFPAGAREHGERAIVAVERSERDETRKLFRVLLASAAVGEAFRRAAGPTVLLDATADAQVLEALARAPVPQTTVRVADGAPFVRRVLYWSNANRRAVFEATGAVLWSDGLRRYLREALRLVLADGRKQLALFSFKPLIDVFRDASDAEVRALYAWLREQGAELTLGHYGATRGRDDWMHCDGFVSVGDPRANLGASRAIAAAIGLQTEHEAIYRRATAAELSQTAGRARAPWRSVAGSWVHVGTIAPASWDSQASVLAFPPGPTHCAAVHVSSALTGRQAEKLKTPTIPTSHTQPGVDIYNTIVHSSNRVTARNHYEQQFDRRKDAAECNVVAEPKRQAIAELVEAVGGVAAAVRITGCGRATVYHWLARTAPRAVPAEARAALERAVAAAGRLDGPTVNGSDSDGGNGQW